MRTRTEVSKTKENLDEDDAKKISDRKSSTRDSQMLMGFDLDDDEYLVIGEKQSSGKEKAAKTNAQEEKKAVVAEDTQKLQEKLKIVLKKPDGYKGGFGVKINGAMDRDEGEKFGFGVVVTSKDKGSPAASNAALKVGLQIVTVEDQDVSTLTKVEFANVIKKIQSREFRMELLPNKELFQAYGKKKTTPTKGVSKDGPLQEGKNSDDGKIELKEGKKQRQRIQLVLKEDTEVVEDETKEEDDIYDL